MPEWQLIDAGDYTGAIAGLDFPKKRSSQLCQLNARLGRMAACSRR